MRHRHRHYTSITATNVAAETETTVSKWAAAVAVAEAAEAATSAVVWEMSAVSNRLPIDNKHRRPLFNFRLIRCDLHFHINKDEIALEVVRFSTARRLTEKINANDRQSDQP